MADSGMATLDAMIDRLKTLAGSGVGNRVAVKAAPLVDAAVKKTAKAGTTPTGEAWKPKKGGGRPLVNAASHFETVAIGNFVIMTLHGPDVFHHKGLGWMPHRQIIPDTGAVPQSVKDAMHQAAKEVFLEITGGRT